MAKVASIEDFDHHMRALLVVSSLDRLGAERIGVRLESFAAGYFTLLDAGFEVLIGSPLGGSPPLSLRLAQRPDFSRRFEADAAAREDFADTLALSEVCAADFCAAYYADGLGALVDLAGNADSLRLLGALHDAGHPCAFVGYAVAALLDLRDANGVSVVRGLSVTATSEDEDAALGFELPAPSLAQRLRDAGAGYVAAPAGAVHVIEDANLITGQNTVSSEAVARALVVALQRRR